MPNYYCTCEAAKHQHESNPLDPTLKSTLDRCYQLKQLFHKQNSCVDEFRLKLINQLGYVPFNKQHMEMANEAWEVLEDHHPEKNGSRTNKNLALYKFLHFMLALFIGIGIIYWVVKRTYRSLKSNKPSTTTTTVLTDDRYKDQEISQCSTNSSAFSSSIVISNQNSNSSISGMAANSRPTNSLYRQSFQEEEAALLKNMKKIKQNKNSSIGRLKMQEELTHSCPTMNFDSIEEDEEEIRICTSGSSK